MNRVSTFGSGGAGKSGLVRQMGDGIKLIRLTSPAETEAFLAGLRDLMI